MFRKECIISPRYEFVNVRLNEQNLGIYALEEHFHKILVENNRFPAGPIIKFNENILWADRARGADGEKTAYFSSNIDGFGSKKIGSDKGFEEQYVKAVSLLHAFRLEKLSVAMVFDIQKLATYYALTDLLGAQHTAIWHNLRFYYNPVTSLLEPIIFDAMGGELLTELIGDFRRQELPEWRHFIRILFDDPEFTSQYHSELLRITEKQYLDDLFKELEEGLNEYLEILSTEFTSTKYSKAVFYQNQAVIQKLFYPVKGFHAYLKSVNDQGITLELGNIQVMPIAVLSVSSKDKKLLPEKPIILSGKHSSNTVHYQKVHFLFLEKFKWSDQLVKDLKVDYKILGTENIRSESVFPWTFLSGSILESDITRQESNAHEFEFIKINDSQKTMVIKPGKYNIESNLIISSGYRVYCQGATELNLVNNAVILSYSPFFFSGTDDEPISIQSSDGTGQGIVFLNTGGSSVFHHVSFNSLSHPSQNDWKLTGSITFYQSSVELLHCRFQNSKAEDALHIIRSDFSVDNCFFEQTFSDAFDADFCSGKINNSSFVNIGNDAIDISGSKISLGNIFIKNVNDKGVSIGEASVVNAKKMTFDKVSTAVVSKDLSVVSAKNLTINNSNIGLAVYQKKAEFGPASVTVSGLDLNNVMLPYLVESNSTLIVNDDLIGTSEINDEIDEKTRKKLFGN